MENNEKLEIMTDRGLLTAIVDNNPHFPAIKIYLGTLLITIVECDDDEIQTIVFADSEQEEYTDKIIID